MKFAVTIYRRAGWLIPIEGPSSAEPWRPLVISLPWNGILGMVNQLTVDSGAFVRFRCTTFNS